MSFDKKIIEQLDIEDIHALVASRMEQLNEHVEMTLECLNVENFETAMAERGEFYRVCQEIQSLLDILAAKAAADG